ncbi:Btbd1 [Symbiodinium microadriaticum]|nr:Btbd1 [Symbiodinium microadriaticum]
MESSQMSKLFRRQFKGAKITPSWEIVRRLADRTESGLIDHQGNVVNVTGFREGVAVSPSCVVFGVKREVATEDRYVAWEEDLSSTDVIRFSIVLDFPSRTITYVADRGERVWTASLGHDGPVYPVIAASGPHFFSIE